MNNKDSSSKRSVPSPKVHSLREAMGLSPQPGYGEPVVTDRYIKDDIRGGSGGAGKSGGKKSKGMSAIKSGYDVKTRVKLGGSKKKK